jgi:hypothetical protein
MLMEEKNTGRMRGGGAREGKTRRRLGESILRRVLLLQTFARLGLNM